MTETNENNFDHLCETAHAELAALGAAIHPPHRKSKTSTHHHTRTKKSRHHATTANVIIPESVAENPQSQLSDAEVVTQLAERVPVTRRPLIVLDVGHGYVAYDGTAMSPTWLQGTDKGGGPKELILPDGTRTQYQRGMKLEIGTIVIDPGAQVNGNNEADINLGVAIKLAPKLRALGFDVEMTRASNDEAVANRFDARRAIGADRNKIMQIVLHSDENASGVARELDTYYSMSDKAKTNSQSRELAIALGDHMVGRHNTTLIDAKLFEGIPAVLVEMGNMRCPDELTRLTSETGQNAIANTLALRIHQYYTDKHPDATAPVLTPAYPKLPVIDTHIHNTLPLPLPTLPATPANPKFLAAQKR